MGKSEKMRKNVMTQGKTRISDNSQDRAKNPIAQGFDKSIRSSCQKQVKIKLALFREEETSSSHAFAILRHFQRSIWIPNQYNCRGRHSSF